MVYVLVYHVHRDLNRFKLIKRANDDNNEFMVFIKVTLFETRISGGAHADTQLHY